MKPAPFDYARPRDLNAALDALADEASSPKPIAGGQSLGPMLNLRLAQPGLLVDIGGLAELRGASVERDILSIGACVTHADIEDGRIPDVTNGAMRAIAADIAYRPVRNRGTIGGSLAHSDPAADWVTTLIALRAKVELRARGGERIMPVEDFMTGALANVLAPGELLVAVRVPRLSPAARVGLYKVRRKTGEFANAFGVLVVDPDRGLCRAVMGALERRPVVVDDARSLFGGRAPSRTAFDAAFADRLLQDAGLTETIDRDLHIVALRRAIERAIA